MPNNIYISLYTFYIVYKTTCKVNRKVYIGCHSTNDLCDGYLGSGKQLLRAIKKYGKSNFEREILFFFDSPADMFAKEQELVTESFVASSNTYNLVPGGSGGFKVLDVTDWKNKLKQSSANRKNKQPMLGKTHSAETKERMSASNKGRTPWNKGLPGTWVGKAHTPESKEKYLETGQAKLPEVKILCTVKVLLQEENGITMALTPFTYFRLILQQQHYLTVV